jgi:hypothetical protein
MKPNSRSKEQDWRLEAELDVSNVRHRLGDLVGRLRDLQLVREIESEVPHDVVITHNGSLLFAYAADRAILNKTLQVVNEVLRHDNVNANIRVSYWNHELDCWRQTDPPLAGEQKKLQGVSDRALEMTETRTLVACPAHRNVAEHRGPSDRSHVVDLPLATAKVRSGRECK